jgi:HSP20 family protein
MSTFHRTSQRPFPWSPFSSLAHNPQHPRHLQRTQRTRSATPRVGEDAYHGPRGVFPPVNLHESEEGYVLTAELPGVLPENIDVSIEGATITLSGERKIEQAAGDGVAVHRRERQSGSFRRAFELPSEIDFDHAKAKHKNGVLSLELPKSAALKPRQIEIETR